MTPPDNGGSKEQDPPYVHNHALRAYLTEARYECLRALRAPGFALPALILPAAFYLLFGVVLVREARTPDIDRFIFTGFAVFGVMGPGLFGFGVFVAQEREQGLLALKRALPMPPSAYMFAKMLMTTAFAAAVTAILFTVVLAAGRVNMTAAQMLGLGAILIAGSLPFCAMGLFVGTRTAARSAPAIVNLLYLPMVYLSGILIPLPDTLASIQLVSPAYHLGRLALAAAGSPSQSSTLVHGVALAGVTLVLGGLALRRFNREG
jgi:ABC-2 type transport system permease protein